jgi:hypothetical protein
MHRESAWGAIMFSRNWDLRRFFLTTQAAFLALGLLFLGGPARAQDADGFTLLDVATQAAGAYPVAYLAVETKKAYRQFFATYGVSGECGKLYELIYNSEEFKWEVVLRYTFNMVDKAGCNPVKLIEGRDGPIVLSENYGKFGTGGILFYDLTDDTFSTSPIPAGYTFVGGSLVAPTPDRATPAPAAQGGVLYLTTSNGGASDNGAILASNVSSTGTISAPTLIFSFPGGVGGAQPMAPAVAGADGNLYGTTYAGGSTDTACTQFTDGCGIVYRLTPPTGKATEWEEHILHTFAGGTDFAFPQGRLTFDADGNVYGSAPSGGSNQVIPSGGVFMLSPHPKLPWPLTQLYVFSGGTDGSEPHTGVTLDADGNVFGTTLIGGAHYVGVVFKLRKPAKPTSAFWKEVVLHTFKGGTKDGAGPSAEVTLIGEAVYGTTYAGGAVGNRACAAPDNLFFNEPGCGVVFQLTPK